MQKLEQFINSEQPKEYADRLSDPPNNALYYFLFLILKFAVYFEIALFPH